MNKVILCGRLTKDPDVRYTSGATQMCISKFTIAVDRKFKKDGEPTADFINCVSFGKIAEFGEKYFKKGIKIIVSGRIQTGSYTNKEGQKVYTTDVVVEEQEFAESKNQNNSTYQNQSTQQTPPPIQTDSAGFMQIPDGIDEELPFA